ncbi:MAG: VWA domain-containing protein [Paracoccaceae bacterium]
MLRFLWPVLFSIIPLWAAAQENTDMMLVLDASGSMWGQIDGVAKITIAQEVIETLLTRLPDNQVLGLSAYGHRRKGDCGDIETLIAPARGTKAAIIEAVNAIKPKGKTPLSAAVLAAAEDLRYTENAATVLLISDGRETCKVDPCIMGRRLEELGVNFTANIIGFDISEGADEAQLRCLAEETGGVYLTASNAAELSAALAVVAQPTPTPEPVIVPAEIRFKAINGEGGEVIGNDLAWDLFGPDGAQIVTGTLAPGLAVELSAGNYRVVARRPSDSSQAEARVTVAQGAASFTVVMPELHDTTMLAPETAVAGSLVPVSWTGPDVPNNYIAAADPGARDNVYYGYSYTREKVVMLRLPPEAGSYELRFIERESRHVLARRMIEVTPVSVSLEAPEEVLAGADAVVTWQGPDYQSDYISVAKIDAKPETAINYTYTRDGSPLKLQMPVEPGTYEIRYIMRASRTVVARRQITVSDLITSVAAPSSAPAGATILVDWTGGDYRGDYISVAEAGSGEKTYVAYSYTSYGSPLGVTLPLEPGEYELRYVFSQDREVAARQTITVTPVDATVSGPASVIAGSVVDVSWTGPGYQNDYVTIAGIGSKDTEYNAYTYTSYGSPIGVEVPSRPGDYEIRYVANGSPDKVLARAFITVTPVSASLSAADTAPAGGSIIIEWQGPNYKSDYIGIAKVGIAGYETYTYVREGTPLTLQLPKSPGTYELRYFLGQDRSVIATRTVTLE